LDIIATQQKSEEKNPRPQNCSKPENIRVLMWGAA